MKCLMVSARDGAPILKLRWADGVLHADFVGPNVLVPIVEMWQNNGLLEWVDNIQRRTLSTEETFLRRLNDYLARQHGFGLEYDDGKA